MEISLKNVIRPTQLQPQIYSIINSLAKKDDFKVIINKENKPVCVLISYNLLENIDLKKIKNKKTDQLINQMKEYYGTLSEDETLLINEGIDDGI